MCVFIQNFGFHRRCFRDRNKDWHGREKSLIGGFYFLNIFLATCIFLFFYNEPELGVGINTGMALTPLPSSIGQR
jgi:hypothetical protein